MTTHRRYLEDFQWQPRWPLSLLLFGGLTGSMGILRLYVFPDQIVALTYGLPLLICLWYPSRALLWSLCAAFALMAAYKVLLLLPVETPWQDNLLLQWGMQIMNITAIGAAVHVILNLLDRLRLKQGDLEQSNQELLAREEEVTRQNEEIQQQSEELQQQSEELQQQAEELQAQADELQSANRELASRQALMENLLGSLHGANGGGDSPRGACEAMLKLFAGTGVAVAVIVREGEQLVVKATSGSIVPPEAPPPVERSLTGVVIHQQRAAAISDLSLRPELVAAAPATGSFHAALAAPLRLAGKIAGALEVYSDRKHEWTREQFQIAEWAADQLSLILDAQRLHEQLLASNTALEAQVKVRTRELQEMVHELEHFSYTITHDLRAPLRAMHGFAGVLQEECLDALNESGREYLQRIATAARRMDQLITDALNYSKAVRQELAMTPVDAVGLLRGIIQSYPMFQPPKSRIEMSDGIPAVLANEAGLTQCFSNLLDNAVKFVAPGAVPHVRIRAEERDEAVRLWFEDNGIGIAPAMRPRMFQMFQRGSKEYDGTGIGLALVRKVAERMGGKVGFESAPGQGSRFWLDLKPAR
jgi:signal transduction histidine kinase